MFLNTVMEYYWGNATLSLKCTNLLDSRTFHRIIDNGITRYSGEYQLRGRTILFGIRNKNHIKHFMMKNYRKLLVMGMMLVGMNVSAQVQCDLCFGFTNFYFGA